VEEPLIQPEEGKVEELKAEERKEELKAAEVPVEEELQLE